MNTHILNLWNNATPYEVSHDGNWYFRVHDTLQGIADKHGLALATVCGVFSALSPNNQFLTNVRDTDTLCTAYIAGATLDTFKVSTYGSNKRKAWKIVAGADALDVLGGLKTRNFYCNLLNPEDVQPVTIDGHMFHACQGKVGKVHGATGLTPKVYERFASDIRDVAGALGYLPHVVQAVCWSVYKRQNRKFYNAQTELWEREQWEAGTI